MKRYRAIILIPTYVDFDGPPDLKTAGQRAIVITENMGGVSKFKSKLLTVELLQDPPLDPPAMAA